MNKKKVIARFYDDWTSQLDGLKDTLHVFSALESDKQRITFMSKLLETSKIEIAVPIFKKDDNLSSKFRESGNQLYQKCKFEDALLCYNKSVAHADNLSMDLAKAYGNRASCFMQMKESTSALSEIERALSIVGIDDCYKKKLLKRKEDCLNSIQNIQTSNVSPPSLTSTNLYFDSASEKVSLNNNSSLGRHLVSNNDVLTGEILIKEVPYAQAALPSAIYSHCTHCLKRSPALIPCIKCNVALFCSETCLTSSLNAYHSIECNILETLINAEIGHMDLLALRIMLLGSGQGERLSHLKEEIDLRIFKSPGKYDSLDFMNIFDLVGNTEKRLASDLFRRAFVASFMVSKLKDSSFPILETEDYDFVGGIILKFMQSLPCNAHEITEFLDGEAVEIGCGAYATLSLLNHSCDPNVVRQCYGSTVVLRAIRPILKGQEIVDNYGYHYATHSLEDRRSSLDWQYYFTCQCVACVNKWPLYSEIPSSNVIFKCDVTTEASRNYANLTQKFEDKLEQVLKDIISYETLQFLCEYLDFLDKNVERPWQNYNACQEAIKHCFQYCPKFRRNPIKSSLVMEVKDSHT